jgi:pyruvate dehydrogenase (quinone)
MAGDPKFPGSQSIPDAPYAEWARLLGLTGIRCDDPRQIGKAWDEALASKKPCVLEVVVSDQVPPIPPHIKKMQAKKAAKAMMKGDPEMFGIVEKGAKQKMHEFTESAKTSMRGGR